MKEGTETVTGDDGFERAPDAAEDAPGAIDEDAEDAKKAESEDAGPRKIAKSEVDDIRKQHQTLASAYRTLVEENQKAAEKAPIYEDLIEKLHDEIDQIHIAMEVCKSSELGALQGKIAHARTMIRELTQPNTEEDIQKARQELASFEASNEALFQPSEFITTEDERDGLPRRELAFEIFDPTADKPAKKSGGGNKGGGARKGKGKKAGGARTLGNGLRIP